MSALAKLTGAALTDEQLREHRDKILIHLQGMVDKLDQIPTDEYSKWRKDCIDFVRSCSVHLRAEKHRPDVLYRQKLLDRTVLSFHIFARNVYAHYKLDGGERPTNPTFVDVTFDAQPLNAYGHPTRAQPQNKNNALLMRVFYIQALLDNVFAKPSIDSLYFISWILELAQGTAWNSDRDFFNIGIADVQDKKKPLEFPAVPQANGPAWKGRMLPLVLAALLGCGKIIAHTWPAIVFGLWGRGFLYSEKDDLFLPQKFIRDAIKEQGGYLQDVQR